MHVFFFLSSIFVSVYVHFKCRSTIFSVFNTCIIEPLVSIVQTNTGSSYRKRGNILCNMFEEPDQETAVPAKVRRYSIQSLITTTLFYSFHLRIVERYLRFAMFELIQKLQYFVSFNIHFILCTFFFSVTNLKRIQQ